MKTGKKGYFYSILRYKPILELVKSSFCFVFLLMLTWGLSLPSFKSLPRFLRKKLKKKVKKAHFYSILLYKPILKLVKNHCLLCLLRDAHLGLFLAKFQVIAAIFEREIKKKVKKAHLYPMYAP